MPWAAPITGRGGAHRLGVRAYQEEGFSDDSKWEVWVADFPEFKEGIPNETLATIPGRALNPLEGFCNTALHLTAYSSISLSGH